MSSLVNPINKYTGKSPTNFPSGHFKVSPQDNPFGPANDYDEKFLAKCNADPNRIPVRPLDTCLTDAEYQVLPFAHAHFLWARYNMQDMILERLYVPVPGWEGTRSKYEHALVSFMCSVRQLSWLIQHQPDLEIDKDDVLKEHKALIINSITGDIDADTLAALAYLEFAYLPLFNKFFGLTTVLQPYYEVCTDKSIRTNQTLNFPMGRAVGVDPSKASWTCKQLVVQALVRQAKGMSRDFLDPHDVHNELVKYREFQIHLKEQAEKRDLINQQRVAEGKNPTKFTPSVFFFRKDEYSVLLNDFVLELWEEEVRISSPTLFPALEEEKAIREKHCFVYSSGATIPDGWVDKNSSAYEALSDSPDVPNDAVPSPSKGFGGNKGKEKKNKR